MKGAGPVDGQTQRRSLRADVADLVAACGARTLALRHGQRIDGSESHDAVRFVRSGWLVRARWLASGRRQIIELLLPGDHEPLERAARRQDEVVAAVGPCELAVVSLPTLQAAITASEALQMRFAAAERRRRAILEEGLVRVGRLDALARTANLLCELNLRQQDGAAAKGCDLPLTQTDMADMLGLSIVHTNRSLQKLRRQRLAELKSKRMIIGDFVALADAGDFQSDYLG